MPDAIAGVATAPQLGLHSSVDQAMSALGGMDSEGFLNLLVAQLKYQSPLEPSDPGDLMTQTAALAQLDATQQLIKLEQTSLGLKQAVAASNLLGNQVTALGPDGQPVSGTVDAIRYTTAGPALTVAGVEVGLGSITEVRNGPAQVAAPPPTVEPEMWEGPLRAGEDEPVIET